MQIRKVFFAALAALPLFAGAASAHGDWGGGPGYGYGYDQPRGYEQGRRGYDGPRNWAAAERSREWGWQRMWEPRRHEPPRGYYQGGGWGPRW